MTAVGRYVPRGREVTAMRVILGTTTRGEIRAFCPGANVGWVRHDNPDDDAATDIRWLTVPHNGNLSDQMESDGDWIVQVAPGHWVIKSDADFNREYVMA